MIPPDVVLSFSYIRGLLSIVRFYWFGSKSVRAYLLLKLKKLRDTVPELFCYRSSRKKARPREAGGWFSRLLRIEVMISTMIVTT